MHIPHRLPLLLRKSRERGSWRLYISFHSFRGCIVPRNAGCVAFMARPRVEVQRYVPDCASFKLVVIVGMTGFGKPYQSFNGTVYL